MATDITVIEHSSDIYHCAVELRQKVLREPLGLSFSTSELLEEKNSIHIVCCHDKEVVACCVLKPEAPDIMRMRQLAVKSDWQRKGLGKQLVAESERIAKEQGCKQMTLHARESVISFYLHLGYAEQGEIFFEIGLPHKLMYKSL